MANCNGRGCDNKFVHLLGKQGTFKQKMDLLSRLTAMEKIEWQWVKVPWVWEPGQSGGCFTQKAGRVFPSPTRSPLNLCECEEGGVVPTGLLKSVVGYNCSQRSGQDNMEIESCSFLNTQCNSFVLLMREPHVLYRLVLQSASLIQFLRVPEKINHKFKCLWGWSSGKECN